MSNNITKPFHTFLIGHNCYFFPFAKIFKSEFEIFPPRCGAELMKIGFQNHQVIYITPIFNKLFNTRY